MFSVPFQPHHVSSLQQFCADTMQASVSKSAAANDAPSKHSVQPSRPPTPAASSNSLSTLYGSRRWQKALAIGASVVVGLGVAATVVWVTVERTKPPEAVEQDVSQTKYSLCISGARLEYEEAEAKCEAAQMILAMPKSDKEVAEFTEFLNQNKAKIGYIPEPTTEPTVYWAFIGLSDGDDEGNYKWTDGTDFQKGQSLPFMENDPNDFQTQCVSTHYDKGSWKLIPRICNIYRFICQSKAPTTPVSTMSTTTANNQDGEDDDDESDAVISAVLGISALVVVCFLVYWFVIRKKKKELNRRATTDISTSLQIEASGATSPMGTRTSGSTMGTRTSGSTMGARRYGSTMGTRSSGSIMGTRSSGSAIGTRSSGSIMGIQSSSVTIERPSSRVDMRARTSGVNMKIKHSKA